MSRSSPDDVPRAVPPWWVRVCRVGWKGIRYFWVTFLLALVLPKAVEMLFSDKPLRSLPNLWPLLEGIVSHPIWTLLIFLGLLLLTGLFWFGSQERNAPTPRALSEHDRVHMLRRLRLRYEQMLSQSLQGAVQVELGLTERPASVQNAASLSFHLPHQPEQLLSPHTSIREAYEQAQQELLILGEPGTGKSTLLLELAQHLVEKAEQNAKQPLPVLLPLSSWATTHPPLQEWLSEQVALLYDVPRSLSQQWIQEEQLLPLLDGLDEMEVSKCPDCIAAINTYHRGHLQPLVVCSRTNEYETAAKHERLALHTAVVVQPLSPKQVNTHLAKMGRPLTALRTALRKNDVLQELATTPLMLQILILTYHDTSVRELSQKEVQLREQIWDDYVQHMVKRKRDAEHYPLHQTVARLSWLARQMRKHNQTIFYLEQLQPDWLQEQQRSLYSRSLRLLYGPLIGGWFFCLLASLTPLHSHSHQLPYLFFSLLVGLLVGLFAAGLVEPNAKIQPTEVLIWSWRNILIEPVVRLVVGLVVGLVIGLIVGVVRGLITALSSGLSSGLVVILSTVWDWGLFFALGGGLIGGLSSMLDKGFSGKQLSERLQLSPNEGIRRSAVHGLVTLLVGILVGILVGALLGGPILRWLSGSASRALFGGPFFGLRAGLFAGALTGLVYGTEFGLRAVAKHLILRFWLWRTHDFPWKAVSFLENATTCILLRRVGGGYSFVHRLLLEHFADLNTGRTLDSAAPLSVPSHPPSPTTPSA